MHQLLTIETLLKLAGGLVLIVLPLTACRVMGLPKPASGLWPRLLGSVLIGIAGATYLEGATRAGNGLGLGGVAVINLSAAAVLIALLILRAGADTVRGRLSLGLLAAVLILLSLVEIAYL